MDRLLTLDQVVRQSAMCHPEWTVEDHVMYFQSEVYHIRDVDAGQVEASMRRLRICPLVVD